MPVPQPDDIANQTRFNGVTYYQLKGRDPEGWWSEHAKGWTDGHADWIFELGDEREKLRRIIRERKEAVKNHQRHRTTAEDQSQLISMDVDHMDDLDGYDKQIREVEEYIQLLVHLKAESPRYGSKTWFG